MDTKSVDEDRDGVNPNHSLLEGTEASLPRMLEALLMKKPLEAMAIECEW